MKLDLRKMIVDWVKEVGEFRVEQELMLEVRAPTTRSRLLKGNYPNPPTGLLEQACIRALEKSGRLPAATKAV